MYAVFKSGGKQHRVSEGEIVRLEKLSGVIGDFVEFNEVLMIVKKDEENEKNIDVKICDSHMCTSKIKAEIVGDGRGKKIKIIKFRRRKHYRKQQGHRQSFTDVKIINISA